MFMLTKPWRSEGNSRGEPSMQNWFCSRLTGKEGEAKTMKRHKRRMRRRRNIGKCNSGHYAIEWESEAVENSWGNFIAHNINRISISWMTFDLLFMLELTGTRRGVQTRIRNQLDLNKSRAWLAPLSVASSHCLQSPWNMISDSFVSRKSDVSGQEEDSSGAEMTCNIRLCPL